MGACVLRALAKAAMVAAAAAGTGLWVGVWGSGGVSLYVSIHMMNGRMMSSVGHHSLVEPKAKIGDEQLRVYCERTEGVREGWGWVAMMVVLVVREGGNGVKKAGCYFSPGVVMETAASLQMETSRDTGIVNQTACVWGPA